MQTQKLKSHPLVWMSVLVLLVILNLCRALPYPFNFDSLSNLTEEILSRVWQNFSPWDLLLAPRSVVSFLFAFNYYLTGIDEFWFRFVNVCFHAANTVLVYAFLLRLIGNTLHGDFSEDRCKTMALVGALIFGLNPAGLYAVVYVVQRYTVVATFFSLLCVISYLSGLTHLQGCRISWRGRVLFYASVVFYLLAVHSKEHIVMLPGVLVCLTILLKKYSWHSLRVLWPPFVLFIGIAVHTVFLAKVNLLRVYEPHAELVLHNLQTYVSQSAVIPVTLERWELLLLSICNQCGFFFRYLYLWIIPDFTRMAIELNFRFPLQLLSVQVIVGGILFLSYILCGVRFLLKGGLQGVFGFGLLYPAILFTTEFSTVRFHESFVIYRSYLWMAGFFAVVPLVTKWVSVVRLHRGIKGAVFILYCFLLITVTQHRLLPFQSDLTLWRDVATRIDFNDRTIPNSFRAAGNLGSALGKAGFYDEAIRYYEIAATLNPGYILPWHTLGAVIAIEGNKQEAIRFLERAIKINPGNAEPYYNLGSIYSGMQDYQQAISYLKKSVTLDPTSKSAVYNLANAFFKSGDVAAAIPFYRKALAIDARYNDARHNLTLAYYEMGITSLRRGQVDEAQQYLREGLAVTPDFEPILKLLNEFFVNPKK